MELHKALQHIIQTEGQDIIKEIRLVNILDDFNAYQDIPASKYILRAIIAEGYTNKLLVFGKWDNNAEMLSQKFSAITGFIPESVSIIFQSISFGLGWIKQIIPLNDKDSLRYNSSNRKKVSPTRPWGKLSVEDRELFLNSLVEIQQSKCGLKYDSIYIADDSNSSNTVCFYINYEVSGPLPKNACVNLSYAIYDKSNRLRKKDLLTSSLWPQKNKTYNIINSSYVNLNFKYTDIGRILIFIED